MLEQLIRTALKRRGYSEKTIEAYIQMGRHNYRVWLDTLIAISKAANEIAYKNQRPTRTRKPR